MLYVSRWTVGSALVVLAALSMLLIGQASAVDPTGPVTVTVTAEVIDITITGSPVAFGTQALNAAPNTTSATAPNIAATQTVTNNGAQAVTALLASYDNIAEADCTDGSGTTGWQATATHSGTAGVLVVGTDVFGMRVDSDGAFNSNPEDGETTIPLGITPSGDILGGAGIDATNGTATIDFELQMPSGTTFTDQCSIPVTLTATS